MAKRTENSETFENSQTSNTNENTDNSTASVSFEPKDRFSFLDVENQQPQFEYYWASTQRAHPQSAEVMKRWGYEVVPSDSKENPIFAEQSHGGHVVGDLVLMRIPKEKAEAIRKAKVEAFNRRLQAEEAKHKEIGRDVEGVEVGEPETDTTRSVFFFPNNPLAK